LEKSEEFYAQSLKIMEQEKNPIHRARLYNNMGKLYAQLKNFPESEKYFLAALQLWRESRHADGKV
jgi:hypothetical protein